MSINKSNWIPVKNRLPEENIDYLCLTESGIYMILKYNTKHKLFNVQDDYIDLAIYVEYWMPLPEPPPLPNLKKEIVPQKSRYEKLVEHHQCTDCGKPLPEGYKLRKCPECLAKHREYARTYSKGRCIKCNTILPPSYEYKTCKSCRVMNSKKYYAKKESR